MVLFFFFFFRRGKEIKIGEGQKEWSESYAVHRKTGIPQFQIQSYYIFVLYSHKST